MSDRSRMTGALVGLALAVVSPLGLAACGGAADEPAEEKTYEVGATDQSGGELIVADPEAEGVEVTVPETAMTNVPPGEETPTATPSEEPAPE